jgi:hypothetical protein
MIHLGSQSDRTPAISHAEWKDIGKAAALSVSATANVAVTEWRNSEGYKSCPVRVVKFIATEILYAGIVVLGALETVAKIVCTIVFFPLFFIAECFLKSCLPECVTKALGMLAAGAIWGTVASAATTVDAVVCLVKNLFSKPISLNITNNWAFEGSLKKMLTAQAQLVEIELVEK